MSYNGWSNYATWRVHLEVFDGMDFHEWRDFDAGMSQSKLVDVLKEWVEDVVISDAEGLVAAYARAFLSDVNYGEIAEHILESYSDGIIEEY